MLSAMTTVLGSAMPVAARQGSGLPYNAALFRVSRPNQVANNNQPGRNSHTSLKSSAGLEPRHRRNQFKPCAYASLGVVLVREG